MALSAAKLSNLRKHNVVDGTCVSKRHLVILSAAAEPQQPAWTGEGIASKIANWVINTPLLYNALKPMARSTIKGTAVKRGVDWDGHVKTLTATQEIYQIKEELENKSIEYPAYYLKPFHAYDEGNLNWQAAFEVDPATYAMALRTFKTDTTISPQDALDKLRTGTTDKIKAYVAKHKLTPFSTIVDVGCSTGISTRWLQSQFPDSTVTGLDLSPHFLAVAEYRERQKPAGEKRIKYVHGIAENSGLPDQSVDLMAFNFIIHECPQKTICDFIAESKRVLKSGGVIMFTDNNPRSKTIQNLPPAIATMMKSTEPWSDEYFSFDLEAAMRDAGFLEVVTEDADHRHRTVLGIAP